MSNSSSYLWRKYEAGVPAQIFFPGDEAGLFLWINNDPEHLPELRGWGNLGKHQVGFVSEGKGRCHARVYTLEGAMEWLWGTHCREYNDGVDAADFGEMVRINLLGVWFGENTPYFISTGTDLNQIVGEFVKKQNAGPAS